MIRDILVLILAGYGLWTLIWKTIWSYRTRLFLKSLEKMPPEERMTAVDDWVNQEIENRG